MRWIWLLLFCGATAQAQDEKKTSPTYVALEGGDVYTVTRGTLRGTTVLIKDDKIHRVGRNLTLPEGTTRYDVSGKRVLPGFVSVQSHGLGVSGSGKLSDSLDPYDEEIKLALASGITSAFVDPSGGGGFFGTRFRSSSPSNIVVKMSYGDLDGMTLLEPGSVNLSGWVHAPPSARFQIREKFDKAKEIIRKREDYEKRKAANQLKKGEALPSSGGLDSQIKLLEGKIIGRMAVRTSSEIQIALNLVNDYRFKCILTGVVEGWTLAEEIGRAHVYCIITPRDRLPVDANLNRPNGSRIEQAALLKRAGVKFSVISLNGGISIGGIAGRDLMNLPLEAAFAVRGGLDEETALESITITAAEMLGVSEWVGSIETGKHADLIVLDGNPFDYRTFVDLTFVNGKLLYNKAESPYFSHIPSRGGDVRKVGGPSKSGTTAKSKTSEDPISGTWTGVMIVPAYKMKSQFQAVLKLAGNRVTGTVTTVLMNRKTTQPVSGTFDGETVKIGGTQQGAQYSINLKLVAPGHLKGGWAMVIMS